MLGLSPRMSSYGERSIFMYVLGIVYRILRVQIELCARCVRYRSLGQRDLAGVLSVFALSVHQRPGWKPPIAAASSPSFREINWDDHESFPYWMTRW